jgi:hypothetical protein
LAGKSKVTLICQVQYFNRAWNADLVHQVIIGMQANARTGLAHTKMRDEVSGSGKKPWQQKEQDARDTAQHDLQFGERVELLTVLEHEKDYSSKN